jgi:prepilin-type N-terminal cleavage/methylation domain-containing protein
MTRAMGRRAGDSAFTLIEAVVALMVVSIIVAVAIPAFQGFRRSAQDRAAQDEISRVLAAERTVRQEEGGYTSDAAVLSPLAPDAVLQGSDPAAGVTITLNEAAEAVCLERTSASGATFGVWDGATQGSFYGQGGGLTGACPEAPPGGYEPGGW